MGLSEMEFERAHRGGSRTNVANLTFLATVGEELLPDFGAWA